MNMNPTASILLGALALLGGCVLPDPDYYPPAAPVVAPGYAPGATVVPATGVYIQETYPAGYISDPYYYERHTGYGIGPVPPGGYRGHHAHDRDHRRHDKEKYKYIYPEANKKPSPGKPAVTPARPRPAKPTPGYKPLPTKPSAPTKPSVTPRPTPKPGMLVTPPKATAVRPQPKGAPAKTSGGGKYSKSTATVPGKRR